MVAQTVQVAGVKAIQWPIYGDAAVFQRTLISYGCLGAASAIGLTITGVLQQPNYVGTILPLGVALLMLVTLWAHGRAQSRARRAEIVKSFAGLTVVHDGHAIELDLHPMLGEFTTRRTAARAAIDLGRWAVIVTAYERFYVLTGKRTSDFKSPVAFRMRAVADIVPAINLAKPA